jgi:putative ABC transport system permease protein
MEKLRNTNLEQYKQQGNELGYFIQPLRDIHLKSNLSDEIEVNGSIQNIYLFSCIAIFITLLACINFMNLTTAQSASRAKEVAVRKSVGANHDRLVRQFLLESYFYVIAAVILALAIVVPALAPFNFFTGKNISLYGLFNTEFVGGILAFIFITGLVAGSYPAFYLTHFSPIEVLKGNLRARIRTYGIRNVLVVFQFFISAVLIIATLVVYSQLRFIQKADLGFDKTHVINLLHTRNLGTHGAVFKEELLKQPGIVSASYCNRLPPNIDWRSMFRAVGQQKDFLFSVYEVDHDHLEAMGYKMVSGRFLKAGNRRDTLSVVINETAARKLGLTDFSDKKLFTDYDLPSGREREIIGIIQDFNFQSLKEPIQPLAIVAGPTPNWEMAIRLTGQDTDETVRAIRALWDKYAPHAPFEYSLLEKNFDSKHGSEKRIGFLFMIFTVLAILIACLGLFGLATFTAEQHRKQIGIRKVLGASVTNIVRMLNQNFLKLVLLANLIAWPFTWWIMNQWLDQFAFHAGISWWIFALSATVTFIIAFFSISYRAFKAATGNPVDSLRNE